MQAQLTEQAVYPAAGAFLTQLRSPRWLKYPVRVNGSNRLWQAALPVDALPDGTEIDESGQIIRYTLSAISGASESSGGCQSGGQLMDGDELGLGLLGGDMVRQLQSGDGQGDDDKKRKKLQKALRQIDELKAKMNAGEKLEKTQEGKIGREGELLIELAALEAKDGVGGVDLVHGRG